MFEQRVCNTFRYNINRVLITISISVISRHVCLAVKVLARACRARGGTDVITALIMMTLCRTVAAWGKTRDGETKTNKPAQSSSSTRYLFGSDSIQSYDTDAKYLLRVYWVPKHKWRQKAVSAIIASLTWQKKSNFFFTWTFFDSHAMLLVYNKSRVTGV